MRIQWLYFIILMGSFYSLYHIGNLNYDSGRQRAALPPAIILWVAGIIVLYRLFYLGER